MIVTVSTVIDAPVEAVWGLLDDYAHWHHWIDRLDSMVMDDGLDQAPVGSTRIVGLGGGRSVRERLVAKDSEQRRLSYAFDGPTPYPVRRYVGTVQVQPVTTSGHTFVTWSGDFDADAADEAKTAALFRKVYLSFFAALAGAVGDRAAGG